MSFTIFKKKKFQKHAYLLGHFRIKFEKSVTEVTPIHLHYYNNRNILIDFRKS